MNRIETTARQPKKRKKGYFSMTANTSAERERRKSNLTTILDRFGEKGMLTILVDLDRRAIRLCDLEAIPLQRLETPDWGIASNEDAKDRRQTESEILANIGFRRLPKTESQTLEVPDFGAACHTNETSAPAAKQNRGDEQKLELPTWKGGDR